MILITVFIMRFIAVLKKDSQLAKNMEEGGRGHITKFPFEVRSLLQGDSHSFSLVQKCVLIGAVSTCVVHPLLWIIHKVDHYSLEGKDKTI